MSLCSKRLSLVSTNRPRYLKTWFGPFEINMNYYPYWNMNKRILLMNADEARRLWIGRE